jgi:TM2 domain-containing membrane protein YozV
MYGALFSLLWPGLGQLAQGRVLAGTLFASWALVSAIGFMYASAVGRLAIPIAAEFTVVAVWSIMDAYRHSAAGSTRARAS